MDLTFVNGVRDPGDPQGLRGPTHLGPLGQQERGDLEGGIRGGLLEAVIPGGTSGDPAGRLARPGSAILPAVDLHARFHWLPCVHVNHVQAPLLCGQHVQVPERLYSGSEREESVRDTGKKLAPRKDMLILYEANR
jgi:hypothetical protein